MARPVSWIGRGFEDVPGKPFGWAHNQERDEIRARLRPKGDYRPGFDPRLESRIDKIVCRLRRNRPSLAQRQAAWRARQPPPPEPVIFTPEELAHIAEHFELANDPLAREIWRKAAGGLSNADNAKGADNGQAAR